MRSFSVPAFILVLLATVATSATKADDFYRGKRLNLLINFAPGGPADIEGRLFAKHLSKHIEGAPSIIVQNKDGAGGLVGANYLGEVGPRDGTMLGYFSAAAWTYVIDPASYRVDFRTYEFVAYQPVNVVYYASAILGIKSPQDLLQAKELVAGGLAVDSSKDLLIRLCLDMLGAPYKYVTGYRSSAPARLALQRGEINFFAESLPSYFGVVEPTLVKTGQALPLWHDATYDGRGFRPSKLMEDRSIPSFQEFHRQAKGTPPAGIMWEVYRANLALDGSMLRTLVMPPNAPPAAMSALRTAIERLNHDKDFAEETMRAIQFVPMYVTNPDLSNQVRQTLVVSPEIRTFVLDYIKQAKK
jgi:tripartite-type tricarboxylate transporter receptor subunit TctC